MPLPTDHVPDEIIAADDINALAAAVNEIPATVASAVAADATVAAAAATAVDARVAAEDLASNAGVRSSYGNARHDQSLLRYNVRLFPRLLGTAVRIRWVSLGDSVGDMIMRALYQPLHRAIGGGNRPAGVSLGSSSSGTGYALPGWAHTDTSGVVIRADRFDLWYTGVVTEIPAGQSRTLATQHCDKVVGHHFAQAAAGTFHYEIDGVQVGATIDATVGTAGQLQFTTLSPALGDHIVKIVVESGTISFLDPDAEDTTASGLVYANTGLGGLDLGVAMTNAMARTNLQRYLSNFDPDVITLEAKEASSYYATALGQLFTAITAGAPTADVIGFGTPHVQTSDADQITQNEQLKAACDAYGSTFHYWDGMTLTRSYAEFNALGGMSDGTHPSNDGSAVRTARFAHDFALFDHPALRWPRDVEAGYVGSSTFELTGTAAGAAVAERAVASTDGNDVTRTATRTITWKRASNGAIVMELKFDGNAHTLPAPARLGTGGAYVISPNSTIVYFAQDAGNNTAADMVARDAYVGRDLILGGRFGANGAGPRNKPTISGSRGANAALASLLTELANYGLITDGTTA